jgi:hypothetical protein
MEKEEKTIALVTRKALVSFPPHAHIAIPLKGTCIWVESAIIEYEVAEGTRGDSIPNHFRIIGLTNGQKITKGIQVSTQYGIPHAVVELDDEDVTSLMRQN